VLYCRFGDSLKAVENVLCFAALGGSEDLSQNTIVKSIPSPVRLSLNIRNIDALFPGFESGDFAVLSGASAALASLLCVRAQLPNQLGGLGTNVVYVDGGNTFRLYRISRIAQFHQMNPREVLERIYISRAFTAYQMASLVLDKVKEAVVKFNAKLLIVSDIAGLFLDEDILEDEAKRVFSQVTVWLSKFAKENQLTVLATCPPHEPSRRNAFLHTVICGRANIVLSVRRDKYGKELVLEKHPHLCLGHAEFPSDKFTLRDFMEA
jgi:hypothetical protein